MLNFLSFIKHVYFFDSPGIISADLVIMDHMAQIIKIAKIWGERLNYSPINGLHSGLWDLQNLTFLTRRRAKILFVGCLIYFSEIEYLNFKETISTNLWQ